MAVIHHVFFWLKEASSTEDLNKLLEGIKTLRNIEVVKQFHVGVPAATEERSVIESG